MKQKKAARGRGQVRRRVERRRQGTGKGNGMAATRKKKTRRPRLGWSGRMIKLMEGFGLPPDVRKDEGGWPLMPGTGKGN